MDLSMKITYIATYLDRALTRVAEKLPDTREGWTFDEWFAAGGDLERVERQIEIATQLAPHVSIGSDLCYRILENELYSYMSAIYASNVNGVEGDLPAPDNNAICDFVISSIRYEPK